MICRGCYNAHHWFGRSRIGPEFLHCKLPCKANMAGLQMVLQVGSHLHYPPKTTLSCKGAQVHHHRWMGPLPPYLFFYPVGFYSFFLLCIDVLFIYCMLFYCLSIIASHSCCLCFFMILSLLKDNKCLYPKEIVFSPWVCGIMSRPKIELTIIQNSAQENNIASPQGTPRTTQRACLSCL